MFGAAVDGAVVVVVAEVPWCAGQDEVSAAPAVHFASVDEGPPPFAFPLVRTAISTLGGGAVLDTGCTAQLAVPALGGAEPLGVDLGLIGVTAGGAGAHWSAVAIVFADCARQHRRCEVPQCPDCLVDRSLSPFRACLAPWPR